MQAKAFKKKAMEERVGQAVASGKEEAEKAKQAGGSKVLAPRASSRRKASQCWGPAPTCEEVNQIVVFEGVLSSTLDSASPTGWISTNKDSCDSLANRDEGCSQPPVTCFDSSA